jgi:hypothetical protein
MGNNQNIIEKLTEIIAVKVVSWCPKPWLDSLALAFSYLRPGQSHDQAMILARLGLAYLGLAWLGFWPGARPCTSLVEHDPIQHPNLLNLNPNHHIPLDIDFHPCTVFLHIRSDQHMMNLVPMEVLMRANISFVIRCVDGDG